MKTITPRFLLLCLICGLLTFPQFSFGQEVDSKIKNVHVMYKPENYTINKIDTVINDSIKLTVNHITLMDSYANDYGDITPDSIEYRYRDYIIEINLSIHGEEVVNKKLVKSDFTSDPRYWKNLILYKVWLESSDNQLGQIKLRVGLGLPDLYIPIISTLTLYYDGEIEIKLK
jgi:hypothetical protein